MEFAFSLFMFMAVLSTSARSGMNGLPDVPGVKGSMTGVGFVVLTDSSGSLRKIGGVHGCDVMTSKQIVFVNAEQDPGYWGNPFYFDLHPGVQQQAPNSHLAVFTEQFSSIPYDLFCRGGVISETQTLTIYLPQVPVSPMPVYDLTSVFNCSSGITKTYTARCDGNFKSVSP